jgi:5-methylcytosine-specific restriction protein A
MFAHEPDRLRQVAEAIRQHGALAEVAAVVNEPDEEAPEGRVLLRAHKVRERNRGLVQRRKALAISQHGALACEACRFDFQTVFGELGKGFIEGHHTVPVSQLLPGQMTKVSDLALLCANEDAAGLITWSRAVSQDFPGKYCLV